MLRLLGKGGAMAVINITGWKRRSNIDIIIEESEEAEGNSEMSES